MTSKQRRSLSILSAISRLISFTLEHWKLALIAAFLISPVGPHLRLTYAYNETYGVRSFVSCNYLGSRGIIRLGLGAECPVIAILDSRDWKR